MEQNFVTRKQSLEDEMKLAQWMLACEHQTHMRSKIRAYINTVEKELLDFLR